MDIFHRFNSVLRSAPSRLVSICINLFCVCLQMKSVCLSLQDSNVLVQRNMLEVLLHFFPFASCLVSTHVDTNFLFLWTLLLVPCDRSRTAARKEAASPEPQQHAEAVAHTFIFVCCIMKYSNNSSCGCCTEVKVESRTEVDSLPKTTGPQATTATHTHAPTHKHTRTHAHTRTHEKALMCTE